MYANFIKKKKKPLPFLLQDVMEDLINWAGITCVYMRGRHIIAMSWVTFDIVERPWDSENLGWNSD